MSIKIFCDSCGKEPNNPEFMFEAQVKEIIKTIEMGSKDFNPRPQLKTTMLQLCKECYNDKVKPLLKNEKENKKSFQ